MAEPLIDRVMAAFTDEAILGIDEIANASETGTQWPFCASYRDGIRALLTPVLASLAQEMPSPPAPASLVPPNAIEA